MKEKSKCVKMPILKLESLPASISISSEISWRDVNGETIILNLKSGEYFTLNETGKFLWENICENVPPQELVKDLAKEYNVEAKDVECDVLDFIAGFVQKEVLIINV